jgi:hypothetical protein
MEFTVPILFLGFNRPDTAKKVFQVIREVRPRKLYFSVDGPRSSFLDDECNRELIGRNKRKPTPSLECVSYKPLTGWGIV